MPKRFVMPRTAKSRGDYVAQREIINRQGAARNHLARNSSISVATAGQVANGSISVALTGTAIAGGVLESEIVAGGETLIITVTGDQWVPSAGDNNAITTAIIAGVTGSVSGGTGFTAQVGGAMAHGDVVRTSDTVLTITLPAAASYAITGNETVTVAIPASALKKGMTPTSSPTFVITNEA